MDISMLRRSEFPTMIRDSVAQGHKLIVITLDRRTALRLADDVEFAVKEAPKGAPDGSSDVYKALGIL